jgi:hypothetical protein
VLGSGSRGIMGRMRPGRYRTPARAVRTRGGADNGGSAQRAAAAICLAITSSPILAATASAARE